MGDIVFEISPPLTHDQLNALFGSAWEHHRPRNFRPILRDSLLYIGAFQGQQLGFVNVVWDGGIHAFVLDTDGASAVSLHGTPFAA